MEKIKKSILIIPSLGNFFIQSKKLEPTKSNPFDVKANCALSKMDLHNSGYTQVFYLFLFERKNSKNIIFDFNSMFYLVVLDIRHNCLLQTLVGIPKKIFLSIDLFTFNFLIRLHYTLYL